MVQWVKGISSCLTSFVLACTQLQWACSLFHIRSNNSQDGFAKIRLGTSPTPICLTPVHLSRGIRQHVTKALRVDVHVGSGNVSANARKGCNSHVNLAYQLLQIQHAPKSARECGLFLPTSLSLWLELARIHIRFSNLRCGTSSVYTGGHNSMYNKGNPRVNLKAWLV